MNKWTTILAAGLAAAWGTAAQGEIVSTWEFPENMEALEEEYASSTNVTEMLGVGRTLDKNGVVVLYRTKPSVASGAKTGTAGDESDFSALVVNETQFMSAFRLTRAAAGARSSGFSGAWDQSQDGFGHTVGTVTQLGDGGEGWAGAWSVPSGVETTVVPKDLYGYAGFRVENNSGSEASVTRDFAAAADSGVLTVSALGVQTGDFFWGFSLYGMEGKKLTELFRWGVTPAYKFGYRLANQTAYELVRVKDDSGATIEVDGPPRDVDYTLTWTRSDEGLDLWLSAEYTDDKSFTATFFEQYALSLPGATSVAGFGVTLSNGASMIFDYVEVTAVPEPGTSALLLAGLALLIRRRRSA